jgi:2-phosphosulfolactate phosphatase
VTLATTERAPPRTERGLSIVRSAISEYRPRRVIDVAFTRSELHAADVAVVIDVLRATSTVGEALAAGYRSVICVDSVDRAACLRAPGRVIAGEQRCVPPPGFDQGNSPREAMTLRGDVLVLATTNGAPAIVAAASCARRVLIASLLNLDAVVEALRAFSQLEVQIVCAGTDGAPALEDSYLAGRICASLPGERTDAALIAEAVARGYATPLDALAASTDAGRLTAAGLGADIAHCAQESRLASVPRVVSAAGAIATVALQSCAAHERREELDRGPDGSDGRAQQEPGAAWRPVGEHELAEPSRVELGLDGHPGEQRNAEPGSGRLLDRSV